MPPTERIEQLDVLCASSIISDSSESSSSLRMEADRGQAVIALLGIFHLRTVFQHFSSPEQGEGTTKRLSFKRRQLSGDLEY